MVLKGAKMIIKFFVLEIYIALFNKNESIRRNSHRINKLFNIKNTQPREILRGQSKGQ